MRRNIGQRVVAISDVGNSRENNEDNLFLPSNTHMRFIFNERYDRCFESASYLPDNFCCAVSDGMGGHEFGEVASLKVVEYLSAHYNELLMCSDKDSLSDYITQLNNQFCNYAVSNKNYRNMGATLCGVIVYDKKSFCFNVGDSRAYKFSSGKLQQITVDHSEGQRLFDLQLLTTEELKTFPNRKAIYKYIGQKTTLIPDVFEIEDYSSCSHILLCTDGLTDVLSDDEIESILGSADIDINRKSQILKDLALQRRLNAGDNITLILIEL